jgi:hypothetical protein
MTKKSKTIAGVVFATPAFNHKGVDYIATEFEARVKRAMENPGDDDEALEIFAELEKLGHVVPEGTEVKPAVNAEQSDAILAENARLKVQLEALKELEALKAELVALKKGSQQ